MVDMALLGVFRFRCFRKGMPIRELTGARDYPSTPYALKYIASGEQEQCYRRSKFPSKLDDYEPAVTSWLHSETKNPRKQCQKANNYHQDAGS